MSFIHYLFENVVTLKKKSSWVVKIINTIMTVDFNFFPLYEQLIRIKSK